MHRYLTKQGYLIKLDQVDPEQLKQVKKDLTAKPIVLQAYQQFGQSKEFEVFQQSANYWFLPRFYGLNVFGSPVKDRLPSGAPINLQVSYDLLPHQHTAYDKSIQHLQQVGGGVLSLPCGGGKCLGRGTELLMYDGTIKPVEEVMFGDCLMGDDSTPRQVLSIARGREMMYRIQPARGRAWVCNQSHILSLMARDGSKCDVELTQVLQMQMQAAQAWRLYQVGVQFETRPIAGELSPYQLGYFLGLKYGTKGQGSLTHHDRVPYEYRCNSRGVRLQVLSGLIDACGHYRSHRYSFRFKQACDPLIDDAVYVARSLGLAAFRRHRDGLTIEGDGLESLPVKLAHRQARPRSTPSEALLNTFTATPLGVDDYYGFTLDGNHRYLLADFTVTHNTFLGIKISAYLGRKTLIVVPKECLMDQWIESIEKFTNRQARIGRLQQSVVDVKDKDYVVAMLHSLSMKQYPKEVFADFGCAIIDECFPGDIRVATDQAPWPSVSYIVNGTNHCFHCR